MFFETIYCWFVSLFGGDLADYLSGYICPSEESEGGYVASNQFVMYGFIALGITLGIVLLYYYAFNHPRFNSWWSWLLVLLFAALTNLFIGAGITLGDLSAGDMGDCLINSGKGGIHNSDCWMFGVANFFVSAIFFTIFSFGLKWWSRNCSRSPF